MSQQRGYGLGGVFRSAGRYVNPLLGEVGKIAATAGADLAKNLIGDVIEGKDLKESARERGKEAGKQSLNLGTKRVIEKVQGEKVTPKRSRSPSGGPKRKKPKKSQKGGQKRKNSQKGGARSGSKKQRKAIGVVFPRAMTQKQRRSLPPKDIFG